MITENAKKNKRTPELLILKFYQPLLISLFCSLILLSFTWKVNAQEHNFDITFLPDSELTERKPGAALLRSFAVPGWGQYYNNPDHWRRGQYHLGADILLLSTWIYLHTNSGILRNNMYSMANAYAGINLRNKSRVVELAVGNYNSLQAYNEAQLRLRNWDRLLDDIPENQWNWQSESQRRQYVSLRDRMDRAQQQIPMVISLMVLNRIVSGINAFIQARNYNRNLPQVWFGLPQETGGDGFQATLRFNF
jgi:hypothetical protein